MTAIEPENEDTRNYLPMTLALGAITGVAAFGCLAAAVVVSHPAAVWGLSTTWRTLLIIETVLWLCPTLCCIAAGISGLGVKGLGGLGWFRNPAGWLTVIALVTVPILGIGLAYEPIKDAIGHYVVNPVITRLPAFIAALASIVGSRLFVDWFKSKLDGLVKRLSRRQSRKFDLHIVEPLNHAIAQAQAVEPETRMLDESARVVTESSRNVIADLTGLTPLLLPLVAANPPPENWRKILRHAVANLNASLAPDGSVQELEEALVDTKATLASITGRDLQTPTNLTEADGTG